MIYNPSELPSPDRPPAVNREIVGVLLAMACVSGMLVLYLQESWCPILPSLCLQTGQPAAETDGEAEGEVPLGGTELIRPNRGSSEFGISPGGPATPPAFPSPFDGANPTAVAPAFTTVDPFAGQFPGGMPSLPGRDMLSGTIAPPSSFDATIQSLEATRAAARGGLVDLGLGRTEPVTATPEALATAREATPSAAYPGAALATETDEPEPTEEAYP